MAVSSTSIESEIPDSNANTQADKIDNVKSSSMKKSEKKSSRNNDDKAKKQKAKNSKYQASTVQKEEDEDEDEIWHEGQDTELLHDNRAKDSLSSSSLSKTLSASVAAILSKSDLSLNSSNSSSSSAELSPPSDDDFTFLTVSDQRTDLPSLASVPAASLASTSSSFLSQLYPVLLSLLFTAILAFIIYFLIHRFCSSSSDSDEFASLIADSEWPWPLSLLCPRKRREIPAFSSRRGNAEGNVNERFRWRPGDVLMYCGPGRGIKNQGTEWARSSLLQDSDGDYAHEFIIVDANRPKRIPTYIQSSEIQEIKNKLNEKQIQKQKKEIGFEEKL